MFNCYITDFTRIILTDIKEIGMNADSMQEISKLGAYIYRDQDKNWISEDGSNDLLLATQEISEHKYVMALSDNNNKIKHIKIINLKTAIENRRMVFAIADMKGDFFNLRHPCSGALYDEYMKLIEAEDNRIREIRNRRNTPGPRPRCNPVTDVEESPRMSEGERVYWAAHAAIPLAPIEPVHFGPRASASTNTAPEPNQAGPVEEPRAYSSWSCVDPAQPGEVAEPIEAPMPESERVPLGFSNYWRDRIEEITYNMHPYFEYRRTS